MNHIEDGIVAAADAETLGGKAPAHYLQPRNLLDNSDFAHPVNSQGKSSYTANGYTIDRWMIYSGSGNQAMSLQDGILYFKGYLYQYVPVSDDVTCTFAAKFSDGYILCVSGTASQVQSADLGNAHITFYHQSEMPYPQVTISTVDETQPIGLIWAALYEGSYTADTLPPYVPKGIKVEMLNCGVPIHPRNLLDNSDFRNPVNQRGATTYTGSLYTIDRWRTWGSSSTVTITSDGIKGDGTDASVLYQNIENNKIPWDKAYTMAVGYSDGSVLCASGVFTSEQGVGIWSSEAQAYLTNTDSKTTRLIRLWHATKTIVWAALYEGAYDASTLPPYVPKGYAAELAECMRYYQKFQMLTGTGASAAQRVFVVLPVAMRIMPTISYELMSGEQPQNIIAQTRNVIDVTGAASYSHLSISLSADL